MLVTIDWRLKNKQPEKHFSAYIFSISNTCAKVFIKYHIFLKSIFFHQLVCYVSDGRCNANLLSLVTGILLSFHEACPVYFFSFKMAKVFMM